MKDYALPSCADFSVELLREEHLSALAELEKECFSSPWSYESLKNELTNSVCVFYVALSGNEVIGYVSMYAVSYEGFINNIAVKKAFRRNGVAAALLNKLCNYARENKMQILTLEVRPSNSGAIELYRSFDFLPQGERKDFYSSPRENALIMTKFFN